jgi:hypothetical protein
VTRLLGSGGAAWPSPLGVRWGGAPQVFLRAGNAEGTGGAAGGGVRLLFVVPLRTVE